MRSFKPSLPVIGKGIREDDMMEAREVITDSVRKPIPKIKESKCHPLIFEYQSSPGGIDSNLLILLHGLGDTHKPFFSLGKKLQGDLPQTAILSLQGGNAVPFMEQSSWGFWDVWDSLGQDISNPNPSKFLDAFQRLIEYLIKPVEQDGCGWPSSSIHILGFAHGATAAIEGVIAFTRKQASNKAATLNKISNEETQSKQSVNSYPIELGSLVSVCGDFLSHPTFSPALSIPTLAISVGPPQTSFKKAFRNLQTITFPSSDQQARMPQSEQEWRKIMVFWSKVLRNRGKWELDGNLYTVSPR